MKIQKKRWLVAVPLLLGIGYLAVNPRPLYALFGMGDIVFDPTSYATLGHIWTEDISTGAKILQTYNQTVKIVQNGSADVQPGHADGAACAEQKRLGNGCVRRRE